MSKLRAPAYDTTQGGRRGSDSEGGSDPCGPTTEGPYPLWSDPY